MRFHSVAVSKPSRHYYFAEDDCMKNSDNTAM